MDGVVANLLDVRAVANDGKLVDIGFRESVPLSWSRDLKNPELTAEIPPDASRAIYVLCVFRNRGLAIYRGLDMPIEYHVMLQEPRRYRLWIQVNGKDDVSDRIAFDATADAEGRDINAVVVLADLIDPLQSR